MSTPHTPHTVIRQEQPLVERQRLSLADVLAQWAQNLGGGVGLAIVVGVAVNWRGATAEESVTVALRVGLIVFGVLMAIRAVVDEVLDGQAYLEVLADNGDLQRELEAVNQTFRGKNAQIRDLQTEITRLKLHAKENANFTPAKPPASTPSGADGRDMIEVYYRHPDPAKRSASRDTMKAEGWSQGRYERAFNGLCAAGVIVVNGKRPQWPATAEEAYRLLDNYRESGV